MEHTGLDSAKRCGKGQYPESLPCCGSGGDGGILKEWLAISI
jgi:hypothetical protein